jgi:hypothetical protein
MRPLFFLVAGPGFEPGKTGPGRVSEMEILKGGFMAHLIVKLIARRARLDNGGGDVSKAAEYFRDHAEEWQRYKDEVTIANIYQAGYFVGAAAFLLADGFCANRRNFVS